MRYRRGRTSNPHIQIAGLVSWGYGSAHTCRTRISSGTSQDAHASTHSRITENNADRNFYRGNVPKIRCRVKQEINRKAVRTHAPALCRGGTGSWGYAAARRGGLRHAAPHGTGSGVTIVAVSHLDTRGQHRPLSPHPSRGTSRNAIPSRRAAPAARRPFTATASSYWSSLPAGRHAPIPTRRCRGTRWRRPSSP